MGNKLSKLSKPVAWILHTRGGDVPTLDECYVANAEGMENIRSSALYSQEYVSALLADNEAKDKRIAELEAKTAMTMGVGNGGGSLFVHGDYDSIKAAQSIVFENESLRAKLATPVRLPARKAVRHPAGYPEDAAREAGYNEALFDVGEALDAQGFTVEGDE